MKDASQMPVETVKNHSTGETIPTENSAQNRRIMPFLSMDGRRNIQAVYRAAYDLHKRHSPPVIDDNGASAYWTELGGDVLKAIRDFDEDPFAMDIFVAIMRDLEREYKKARRERNSGVCRKE